jgi:hypothetical protein
MMCGTIESIIEVSEVIYTEEVGVNNFEEILIDSLEELRVRLIDKYEDETGNTYKGKHDNY